ncbi:FAD/NAD(P)-binding domain-containing protein [Wolfiporia cocos MD-104 SS10]|uniref:FAD/NAD(P)-binding domain-containing protein n=1 Tax=Wolfiporia cocos (strain MD-104) TaxID=742152 RepID=A0A2H3JXE0_WOLCO|nr:FAD/NAD(P)-binding domain-containing protein [Wolfiporia cocos MD-104 SS10]
MAAPSRTKVIIAGAGIAGPILAIFLKMKGYEPVVYERVDELADVGLSLCLQPNGLRVLSLIPGFVERIIGKPLEKIMHHSILPDESTVLVDSDIPALLPERTGFTLTGVRRPVFNRTIVEAAQEHGVEIVFGHQLVDLKESEDSVEVTFANGTKDTASFVVGCDGIHSNTRICLFGKEPVDFTGLIQTGGVSPTPEEFKQHPALRNIYADGAHLICYPISDTQTSWAITLREPEAKETWRAMDEERQQAFKNGPFSQWGFGTGGMIHAADRIIKYGLYDRPELKTWHKGRVVLLGDAAHPTSPHLGQGANQAFEDIYYLVLQLTRHNAAAAPPSTALLGTIFAAYEAARVERTSVLVRGARKQGENRVVQGVEACRARDREVREAWADADATLAGYLQLYGQPWPLDGKSEI